MLRFAWLSCCTAVVLLEFGCSGSSDGGDSAPVTMTNLPSRCDRACDKLAECGAGAAEDCSCNGDVCDCTSAPQDHDECVQSCERAFRSGLSRPGCADAAGAIFRCIDDLTCNGTDESVRDACDEVAEQAEGVCEAGGGDDPPRVPVDGQTVCSAGSGSALDAARPAGPPPIGVVCDQSWSECSDGSEYRVSCADHEGTGVAACSCIVDGTVIGGYQDATSCEIAMNPELLNESCGWDLAF